MARARTWAILTVAVLLGCGTAWGQVSADEAQRKLEERKREREAAAADGATTRPVGEPVYQEVTIESWRLKDGAPEEVATWFAAQPDLREEERARLLKQVEQAKQQLETAKDMELNYEKRSTTFGGMTSSKRVATKASKDRKEKAIDDAKARLAVARGELKHFDEHPNDLLFPDLAYSSFRVGNYGKIRGFAIFQVVDDANAIVSYGEKNLWVNGLDFSTQVDDTGVSVSIPMYVSGTRQYTTAIGGSRTVPYLEPFDYEPYIELIETREQKLVGHTFDGGKTIIPVDD